jgi:hypothetical protein
MQDNDIYVKTDAGREEIRSRALGLSMSVRAILLMIDGQRNVAATRAIIAKSKAPADVLDTLLAQGLIEPQSTAAASVGPQEPIPEAPPPVEEPPASLHLPKSAAANGNARAPATTPPIAPPKPPISETRFKYDEPLDLRLPTIYGPAPEPDVPIAPLEEIAPTVVPPDNRYEHLYSMINEIVRDFLPAHRRYFFQIKIERCTSPEALLELLHDLQTILAKSRGEAFAAEVIARVRNAAV